MNGAHQHPTDELSALLDAELGQGEAMVTRAHLEGCRACVEELHGARAVRLALRTLPGVEPPPGVMEALVERVRAGTEVEDVGAERGPVVTLVRRHRRVGAAVASVAVVVLGLSVVEPDLYRPGVTAAIDSHAASLQAMAAGGLVSADGGSDPLQPFEPVTPTTAPPRDPRALPAPYEAPEHLDGGYRLVKAFSDPTRREGLQLVYEGDRYGLSVFETPGRLDFDALPPGGNRVDVDGAEGWRWETPEVDGRVVVFERDGMVLVVVGDEPGDAVLEAARSIPPPRPLPLGQRLRRMGTEVLEVLSP